MAAKPYRAIWGANRRSRKVARSCWACASGPGTRAVNRSTIAGAASTVATVTATSSASEAVTSADTERQASSWSRVRSSATRTGMKTEVSTPPSTSS